MYRRKVSLVVFLFFVAAIFKANAQVQPSGFSSDTSKFISELTTRFQQVGEINEAEAKLLLSSFTYQWESKLLTYPQKLQAQSVCIALSEQKLQVAPYYLLYFKTLTILVKQSASPSAFDLFHKGVMYCIEGKNPSRTLLKYLTQTDLIVSKNDLMFSNTEAWHARNGSYTFAFDTVPFFNFKSIDLACVVRNDSACIYETKGKFYPLTQMWYGNGGKVYWERAGLARDVVYAKLFDYKINTRLISYTADSVLFYHGGYFKKFLPGKLEDKAMVDITAESATFPKFTMKKGDQIYINLFKDVEFFGGFNLQGSRVIGTPADDGFSRIEIKRNNIPFISLKSAEFAIRPDRFVSSRASVLIFIENDSIFHPSVQVRYNLSANELVMSRGDEGLGQSPFFNSYHHLDMYNEAIYWKLNEETMSLEDLKGIRTKSEATFESSDYFSAYRFDKMQGIDDVNPAMLVSAYVRKHRTDKFYAEDYATWAKKPLEQIVVQLIKLANAGFLNYEIDQRFATVRPRLNEFLAARSGVKDSDVILFNSLVEKGSNAQLDLKNFRLTIEGVSKVMLSDSQYVYVAPRDGKVIINKNRDFSFKGRVHAGLFDFIANECTFQYDKFSLSIPNIDSAMMIAPAWSVDANGFRDFVRVKNVLANMNGELFIDSPESKSGRKMLHHYPLLISKDTSYVYFDRKDIVNGAYKKKDFYFQVNPFTMDSINSLPPGDLKFEGTLISAGIFPDLNETIRVQKDYSLGFSKVVASPGLPIYGGKGTYSDTIRLSNRGLRGSGKLNFLSSVTEANDFLFTPDSTSAKVKNYELAKVVGEFEFPDANVKDASIKWFPGKDVMTVQNSKNDSISMFGNKAKLNGALTVTPTGLKGNGNLSFENAQVDSKLYNFKNESFTSDTSDFKLLTDDRSREALRVHVFKASIDFASRQGHFIATGKGALMEFPVIQYNCVVNEFDWLMDKKQLQLINKADFTREKYYQLKPEELITYNHGKEIYTSTDPKQDSLSFFALHAIYDLDSNFLEVDDARIIKVADAAIFPFNGKLAVGKNGMIKELKQAEILANKTNLYHKFYNSNVNIASRKRYTAKGLYDYTPSDGEVTTLEMNNIAINSQGETFASTKISDSMNFMINRYFRFLGKMEVNAGTKRIKFEGGYGFVHDCSALKHEWVEIFAEIDPKNVMIPVPEKPENTGNGKLRASIFYSLTENTIKPGFFSKVENVTDPDIFSARGFVAYQPQWAEYRIADSSKLRNPQLTGNMLGFNTNRCMLSGEGQIDLATNLGQLKMRSAGAVNYFSIVDSTSCNVLSAFDFFFSDDAMKIFADALNGSELNGIDVSGLNYTRSLREFAGQEEADKILTELSLYGQYKKFPDVLNHTLVLTELQLSWNQDLRSFISKGPIGISNLGKNPVNKRVNGVVEIGKRRSGDILNLYFELSENQWYFFTYSSGTMQVLSSDKTFNEKLTGLKESDRVIKGGKGQQSYQFIIGTPEKKSVFLRKMKQTAGDE